MSAFDQTDFSNRCQRLIDLTQKAYIALVSQHPDTDKRLSEVSKDWIDFYLSHGNRNVQPPNMSFISPDIWERNIKDLGLQIKQFLRKKIDSKTYQNIELHLNIFKNEERLTQLHNCFKASFLCERELKKIDNLDLWLKTRLLITSSLIYNYVENLSDIKSELNFEVEDHLDSIKRFKELISNQEKSEQSKQLRFDIINSNIDKTLEKWAKIYYYQ